MAASGITSEQYLSSLRRQEDKYQKIEGPQTEKRKFLGQIMSGEKVQEVPQEFYNYSGLLAVLGVLIGDPYRKGEVMAIIRNIASTFDREVGLGLIKMAQGGGPLEKFIETHELSSRLAVALALAYDVGFASQRPTYESFFAREKAGRNKPSFMRERKKSWEDAKVHSFKIIGEWTKVGIHPFDSP